MSSESTSVPGKMVKMMDTQVQELKRLWRNKRQLTFQGLNLAMVVLSALMIWKSLMVVTKSESPVVVVLRSVCESCSSGDFRVYCVVERIHADRVFDITRMRRTHHSLRLGRIEVLFIVFGGYIPIT